MTTLYQTKNPKQSWDFLFGGPDGTIAVLLRSFAKICKHIFGFIHYATPRPMSLPSANPRHGLKSH